MRSTALQMGVIFLLVVGLCSCGTLTGSSSVFPLGLPLSSDYFPPNAEVTATVDLSQSGDSVNYLMALSTRNGSLEVAVLSPHGIPVYTVGLSGQKRHISRQASSARLHSPEEILDYLGLIYIEHKRIGPILKKNWTYETVGHERIFVHSSVGDTPAGKIHIYYEGEGPWYEVAQLIDTTHHKTLTIRILEYHDVLPE